MGVVAFQRGKKTNSPFSAGNRSQWPASFSRKENEQFSPYFFSWVGAGDRSVYFGVQRARIVLSSTDCAFLRTPIILTNTASMDLGSDWFGCLKRFSRSIIINYYVFPCFLQESNSYSAKDYLKFDCSNYDLHMLKFLWKGFAFCLYEGWLVWIFGHSVLLFKNCQSWNSPSEWAGFH